MTQVVDKNRESLIRNGIENNRANVGSPPLAGRVATGVTMPGTETSPAEEEEPLPFASPPCYLGEFAAFEFATENQTHRTTMKRDHLYLIKHGFLDRGNGPYFCPGCAEMTGLLELYPMLKQHLDIRYVDFARPRPELVSLIGEENQSCPVLVLDAVPSNPPVGLKVRHANGRAFVEGAREIAEYLAHVHGTGIPH